MGDVYSLYNDAGNLVGLKVGLKWDVNLNLALLVSYVLAIEEMCQSVFLPSSFLTLARLPVVRGKGILIASSSLGVF